MRARLRLLLPLQRVEHVALTAAEVKVSQAQMALAVFPGGHHFWDGAQGARHQAHQRLGDHQEHHRSRLKSPTMIPVMEMASAKPNSPPAKISMTTTIRTLE